MNNPVGLYFPVTGVYFQSKIYKQYCLVRGKLRDSLSNNVEVPSVELWHFVSLPGIYESLFPTALLTEHRFQLLNFCDTLI